jgi:hypothetical protein
MNLQNGDYIKLQKFITEEGLKFYYLDGNGRYTVFDVGSSGTAQEITYSELLTLKNDSKLSVGSWYIITDYNSTNFLHGIKGTDYGYNSSYQSQVEPLLVKAASVDEIGIRAYSLHRPNDVIYYALEEYNTISKSASFSTSYGEDNISVGFDTDSNRLYTDLPINYLYVNTPDSNITIELNFDSGDNIILRFRTTELTTSPSTPDENTGSLITTCSLEVLVDGTHRVYFDNVNTSQVLAAGSIELVGYLGKEFKGSITRRVDSLYNVDMGIDWRNVKYKRYEMSINTSELPNEFVSTIWSPLPDCVLPLYGSVYTTTPTGNETELFVTGLSNDVGIIIGGKGQVDLVRNINIKSLDNIVLVSNDSQEMNQTNVSIEYAEMTTIGGSSKDYSINTCKIESSREFNYFDILTNSRINTVIGSSLVTVDSSDFIYINRCMFRSVVRTSGHRWITVSAGNISNSTLRNAQNCILGSNVSSSTINTILVCNLKTTAGVGYGSGTSAINNCDFDFIQGLSVNFRRMEGCRGSRLTNIISLSNIELPTLDILNVSFGEAINMVFTAPAPMEEVTFRKTNGLRFNATLKNVTFEGEYKNVGFQGGFQDIVFRGDFDNNGTIDSNNTPALNGTQYTNIGKEILARSVNTLVVSYLNASNVLTVDSVSIT